MAGDSNRKVHPWYVQVYVPVLAEVFEGLLIGNGATLSCDERGGFSL